MKETKHQRSHIVWLLLYDMSRLGKSIKTKSRLIVTRRWEGRGEWAVISNRHRGFPPGWWNSFRTRKWWWLHNSVNKLNDTKLYTFKWLIVSWILPQLLKTEKKNLVIKPFSIKSSIQQNANIKIIKLGVGGCYLTQHSTHEQPLLISP